MTDTTTPSRPWLWLVIAGVVAAISIAVLWPLQHVGQVCVLIYPPPPGCFSPVPPIASIGAIAAIVALLVAIAVVWFTMPAPRTAVIVLTGAIVLVALIGAGLVVLSQTGIWDPPVLPIE